MVSKRTRALVLLTLQNAGISLLTRYSRRGHHQDLYLPSVAVFSAEVRLVTSHLRIMHVVDADHLFSCATLNAADCNLTILSKIA